MEYLLYASHNRIQNPTTHVHTPMAQLSPCTCDHRSTLFPIFPTFLTQSLIQHTLGAYKVVRPNFKRRNLVVIQE